MVDALRETCRVIVAAGTVVDVRPVAGTFPIECVAPDTPVEVGELDTSGTAADDIAADRAVRDIASEGELAPCHSASFNFEWYWENVAELASYVAAGMRPKRVTPPYSEIEKAHRDISAAVAARTRLRCRRPMVVRSYRKRSAGRADR